MITNKYINILFYSLIVMFVLFLSIGVIMRYIADLNFDIARKLSSQYGKTESELTSWEEIRKLKAVSSANIDYYYARAVSYNILEKGNYARMINSMYLKELIKKEE